MSNSQSSPDLVVRPGKIMSDLFISSLRVRRFLAIAIVLAAGCVKAGDDTLDTDTDTDTDTDADSDTDTDTDADSMRPTVVATSPGTDETDVAADRRVEVTFSEPLDASSVSADTLKIWSNDRSVPGAIALAGATATFTPDDDLPLGARYDVEVTTGVLDLAGNTMYAPYYFSFTTEDAPDTVGPTVLDTTPASLDTNAPLSRVIEVYLSEAVDSATVDLDSFELLNGADEVKGSVRVHGATVTFVADQDLLPGTTYQGRLDESVSDLAGNPMDDTYVWSFTTGKVAVPGLPVDLGTAGNYVILAKSAISTVPASAITGDVAVSPSAATFITGFSLIADATNVFATSTQVTGKVYAADYAVPTPTVLTTAVSDMETAFTTAAGRPPDVTELGAGDISGRTLAPGVYQWGTGLLISTDVELAGSGTDVWIFQIAQDLTVASGARVSLIGGALPKNVFWQVSGLVDLGTTSHLEGVVLTQTSIDLRTGASVDGRLLAQTAIDLDASTVTQP
jgi:hypothetical protein